MTPQVLQNLVACQTQDVVDPMAITPPHESPATETAVGTQHDLDPGPDLAESPDQQFQNRTAVLGRVDVRGTQVRHQKFVTAKNVQRQVAVVVVVPVEEPSLLATVQAVVRGIKVQTTTRRRPSRWKSIASVLHSVIADGLAAGVRVFC